MIVIFENSNGKKTGNLALESFVKNDAFDISTKFEKDLVRQIICSSF